MSLFKKSFANKDYLLVHLLYFYYEDIDIMNHLLTSTTLPKAKINVQIHNMRTNVKSSFNYI